MFHDFVSVVARAAKQMNGMLYVREATRKRRECGKERRSKEYSEKKKKPKRKESTRNEKGAKRGQQAAARPDRRVRAHKTNNKIWNTGKRPRVPVIFQGHREIFQRTKRLTKEK